MKREYLLQFRCAHEGCAERTTYRYDTLRDRKDSYEARHYEKDGWRCIRHSKPNDVLSESNQETHFEVVSREEPHGRFFGHSGFVHGPGFKLFANDFPAGTKLVVTARIELPSEQDV